MIELLTNLFPPLAMLLESLKEEVMFFSSPAPRIFALRSSFTSLRAKSRRHVGVCLEAVAVAVANFVNSSLLQTMRMNLSASRLYQR
jgi:hypothetical protein